MAAVQVLPQTATSCMNICMPHNIRETNKLAAAQLSMASTEGAAQTNPAVESKEQDSLPALASNAVEGIDVYQRLESLLHGRHKDPTDEGSGLSYALSHFLILFILLLLFLLHHSPPTTTLHSDPTVNSETTCFGAALEIEKLN